MKTSALILSIVVIVFCGCSGKHQKSSDLKKVGMQPDGSILVPSNQLLRPEGFQIYLPGRPVGLALTPDEKFLVVKNKSDLDLIRLADRTVMQTLPFSKSGASFTGLCLSPDGQRIYVTDAEDRICIAGFDENKIMLWKDPIVLPGASTGDLPVPGGLCLNEKGDKIYVTLSRNNTLAIINLSGNSMVEIPVGVAPYSVLLVSQSKAYVTNWGGRQPEKGESVYNTSGSKVLVDPKTGIANNGSVSVMDLTRNIQSKSIEVGLHPGAMVLSLDRSRLYVTCANSDQLNPALVSLSGDQLYWAKKSLEQDLDDVDRIDEDTFNRIIWHAVKGYERPYPEIMRR